MIMIIVSNSSFTEDQHAGTSLDCAFADEDKGSKDGDGGAGHQGRDEDELMGPSASLLCFTMSYVNIKVLKILESSFHYIFSIATAVSFQ